MTNPVRIDLTAIRPHASGGVEGVAAGVTREIIAQREHSSVVVTSADRRAWAERLGTPPTRLAVVSGSGGSRMGRIANEVSRYAATAPARERISRAVAHYRARSAASQAAEPVWYPFHRTPAIAKTSVVTLHDLRVFQPGLEDAANQRTITANVDRASALVVSWMHPYRQTLELFPEVADRLFVAPLPVLNPGEFRHAALSPRGPLRVLVPVGTSTHKNQELVIKALGSLDDVQVTFTGGTEEPRFGELRELAGEIGVLDRVRWAGYVSIDELEQFYDTCDVLVMPSRWEAASGPVFEAVARGIPFIATNIAPIASQVEQFQLVGPLVDPDRPDEFAAAVNEVRDNYDAFADAQLEPSRTLRAITWSSCAARYLEILDWAAAKQAGLNPTPPPHV